MPTSIGGDDDDSATTRLREGAQSIASHLWAGWRRRALRWRRPPPHTPVPADAIVYDGDAGILLALNEALRAGVWQPDVGSGDVAESLMQGAEMLANAYRSGPKDERADDGALIGESGVWFVAAEAGVEGASVQLRASLARSGGDGAADLLGGPPGRALLAAARFRLNRDEADRALWHVTMGSMLDDTTPWTQGDRQTTPAAYLGAAHGAAGLLAAVLDAGDLLAPPQRARWIKHLGDHLVEHALISDHDVQWPAFKGGPLLLQWCHGAPGIIVSAAGLRDGEHPALENLLTIASLGLVHARPHPKGPNLCHGTSGLALALLAEANRTSMNDVANAKRLHAAATQLLVSVVDAYFDWKRLVRTGTAPTPTRRDPSLYTGDAGVLWTLLVALGKVPARPPALVGMADVGCATDVTWGSD